MSQYDMNVHDYFRIIRKRKWVIILTTLAVYIAAIIYTKMQTKLYKSTATVIVLQKKINTDEIFGTGQVIGGTLSNYFSSQRTLQTAKDTIMSKSVALRVINQLGLVERNASMSEIDMIISKLLQRIEVSIDEKEGKIFITITSSEPKKATRIVNAFAEAFRVESEKQARYSEQV
ncbi:MAG TPA: Wzz/FepE/Etk N-terminal domain-containing protein, partial [bacterium]|nr:Wzz/FepE/Etk N-terminal domain-containing protein [bacterium]